MSEVLSLGDLSQVPVGRLHPVRAGGLALVLFRTGDEVLALEDRCPHRGFPLSRGSVDPARCIVTCAAHRWQIDLRTGRAHFPRWDLGTRRFPVRVEGGRVLIDLPDEVAGTPAPPPCTPAP